MPNPNLSLNNTLRFFLVSCLILIFSITALVQVRSQTNYAVLLDGIDDNVRFPDYLISGTDDKTFELWLKTDDTGVIFGHQDIEYDGIGTELPGARVPIFYINTDGKLNAGLYNGFTSPIVSEETINDNFWHHIALSLSGTTQTLYIDGVVAGQIEGIIDIGILQYHQAGVGSDEGWPGSEGDDWSPIQAVVDELRLWNVARTEEQINNFKDTPNVEAETGLVSVWHFDEGSDTNAYDGIGTNHASLQNDAGWVVSNVFETRMDDAGITKVKAYPLNGINGYEEAPIEITFKNFGNVNLTSVEFAWEIEGIYQEKWFGGNSWAGNLAPGDSITMQIGDSDFNPGDIYQIKIWTENPNGVEDAYPINDTATETGITGSPVGNHNSALFDGVDDFIEMGLYPDFIHSGVEGQYTVEMWINLMSYKTGCVFCDEAYEYNGIMIQFNSQGFYETYYDGSLITSTFKAELDKWYHIAQVQNSEGIHLYVNGDYYETLVSNQYQRIVGEIMIIGAAFREGMGWENHFNGGVDNLKIWDRAIYNFRDEMFRVEYENIGDSLYAYYDFQHYPSAAEYAISKAATNLWDARIHNGDLLANYYSPVPDWEDFYRDIGLIDIVLPAEESCSFTNAEKVRIVLENHGNQNLTSLVAFARNVSTDETIVTRATRIIQPGDTIHLTFQQTIDLEEPDNFYDYEFWVELNADSEESDNYLRSGFYSISPPEIEISGDSLICSHGTVELTAQGCFDSVSWGSVLSGNTIWVTPKETTTYHATAMYLLQTGEICSNSDTFTVKVSGQPDTLPKVVYEDSTTLCYGDEIILSSNIIGEAGSEFEWNTYETGREIHVNTSGKYYYKYISSEGCAVYSDTVEISVLPQMYLETSDEESVCPGTSVTLELFNADNYLWSTGSEYARIAVSPDTTTTYYFTASNKYDCVYEDSIKVVVFPKTIFYISGDTVLCEGETTILHAMSSTGGSYLWNSGAKTKDIVIILPSTAFYRVNHKDIYGCQYSDSVKVAVFPKPKKPVISSNGPSIKCEGAVVSLSSNILENIEWSNQSTSPDIYIDYNHDAFVLHTNTYGCSSTSNVISVRFKKKPRFDKYNVTTICEGDSTFLQVNYVTSINWSTGDTINDIYVAPENTKTYSFSAENTPYCASTDSVKITVIHNEEVGVISNLLPEDNSESVSKPIPFSWTIVDNAVNYDLLIWPLDSSFLIPVQDINQISYFYSDEAGQLQYGETYNWKIVAKNCSYSNASPTHQFTLRQLPDIVVEEIQIPASAYSGSDIEVNWTIKNNGDGRTAESWFTYVYLSFDDVLDVGDEYIGGIRNMTYLEPQESYTQTFSTKLPEGINDNYYIIVKADADSTLIEENDVNNTSVSASTVFVELTPPPDLIVSDIIVPDLVLSGNSVYINYIITNHGDGPVKDTMWYDQVYLSDSSIWGEGDMVELGSFKHSGTLEKDSSYNQSAQIEIPPYISGNYYIFVTTDIENHVYEHTEELNNQSESSDAINVMLVSPADLIISHASANNTVVTNGDEIAISWFTRNIGISPTPGEWYDNVYLHNEKTTDLRDAIQIGKYLQTETLDLGETKYSYIDREIPDTIFGTYYLYVLADGYNHIFEMGNDDNNLYRFDSIHIITPDIEVSDLTVPESDSSYNFINISWKTANVGETNIKGKPIKYGIYISAYPEFNTSATRIDSLIFQFPLSVNRSIKFTKKIRLPEGASGELFLYVVADYNDEIEEGTNEENNIVQQPIEVILSPWADLSYSDIISSDTVRAGYNMSFSYSVTNVGTSDLDKRLWNDYYYVLHLGELDCGQRCATSLKSEQHYQSLEMGSTDEFNVEVMIPGELDRGWYQLVIVGDSENQLFENTGEPNIIHKLIYIEDYPVDLEVTEFTTPDTASFGDKIIVSWTVKNLSDIPTLGERWLDEVFISKDSILNRDIDTRIAASLRKKILEAGQSYTQSEQVTIPMGITGENYLIVINGNYETPVDSNRSNNRRAKPIYIKETPTPDLDLLQFEAPEIITAGRNVTINYEVTNNGSAAVPGNTRKGWEDKVYLTTKTGNIVIDKNDEHISTIRNNLYLPINESYTHEKSVFIPGNISGNYVLSLITDARNNIYEYQAEDNNQINLPVEIVLPPACDLIVRDIQQPDTAIVGDDLTVSWSVKNNSENSVEGRKIDMLYLSEDKILDQSDVIFGDDTSYVNLSAEQEVQYSITARLKNVIDGEYYLLAKTDIQNDIYETNDTNNTSCSVVPIEVKVEEIPFDSLVTKVLYNDYMAFYKFHVDDSIGGESILVTFKGDSVNAQNQIYIAYESMPTKGVYAYGAKDPEKANQTVVLSEAEPGDYYIMVDGYNSIQDIQSIRLKVEVLNLELFSIVQNTGGNTGKVTVQLNGAKFASDLQVILKNASDTVAMEINELHYKLTVDDKSAGQALYTFIDSVSNTDGIYIKYGEEATTTNYDYAIEGPFSSDSTSIIYPLQEGDYFITIYQSAQEGHLGISFTPPYSASLESINTYDTNSYILPEKVEVINSTLAYATYDLKGKRTGMYHVILMSDEEIYIALDQFEIVQGLPLDLLISVRHPSLVRSFETFKYTIDFKNNGNINIDKNELVVTSYERAPIGFTVKQLDQNLQEIVVKLIEANGPENILRPGASGSIVIYTSAIMDALMCFGIEYPDIFNE
jgi:hypothetical protein